MDITKALKVPEALTGYSQADRQLHDEAVAKLRASLTEYSQHCGSLFNRHYPVDDIVLILAAALGKDRLPELVNAVADAAYKMESNWLGDKLETLAHDAHIKQQAQALMD